MNHLVNELFQKVKVDNEKVCADAITDLCCILEMNTWNLSIEDREIRYGTYISKEIMEIEINQKDESKIIDFLSEEIDHEHKFTSSMIFAMGQASCKTSLQSLINIINKHLYRFNENELYQTLISLERLIFYNESMDFPEKKNIIISADLLNILSEKILLFKPILHSDLESTFRRFFDSVTLLLNEEDRQIYD